MINNGRKWGTGIVVDPSRAAEILENFAGLNVLVVGDLMLDEHVWGSVGRISPEAPVMVVDAEDFEARPGGAANVVVNVQALGAKACVIGFVGKDREGTFLCRNLKERGVDTRGIVRLDTPPYRTTRKIRIWASRRQQVVRVDSESRLEMSKDLYESILSQMERVIPRVDAVLISDYSKGVVNSAVVGKAIELARNSGKVCLSNPKPPNARLFSGASAVTLNQSEAEAVVGEKLDTDAKIEECSENLISMLQTDAVVITRGSKGLSVLSADQPVFHVNAIPTEVYDVAGAGDTVISVLTLGLASGASIYESAVLANLAGGAVVRKVGVATCSTHEIQSLLQDSYPR